MADQIQHVFIPKHSKLSKKDTQELMSEHNISLNQLPKIFKSDPGIQHLNTEPGDVIKIERKSPTAGQTIYYRVVIND